MSAVIQIDLRDNSKQWSNTIKQQFQAAGIDAKKLDQALEDVNAELESRSAAEYSAKIRKIADDMSGLSTKSQAAAKAQSVFWTETMSKFNLAKEAFSWLNAGAQRFGSFSQKMADDGDVSFKRLIKAGGEFQHVLDDMARSREVRDLINDLAAAGEDLLPVIRELGVETVSWFRSTQDGIKYSMEGYIRLAEAVGIVQQGMTQAYREEAAAREAESKKRQAESEKRIAESKARQAAAQAAREAEMINPTIAMSRNAAMAEEVAKMRDVAQLHREINSLVAIQEKLARELKAAGKDPTQDVKFIDNAKELVAYQQRLMDLQKEERERKAKFVEDQAASEKKVRDDQIKGLDDLLAQEKAGSKEAMDLERRKAELIKKNKEEEKRLLKEKGLLEDKLARDDLARIEERARKEREAVLAGIEGERMLWAARDRRRQAEMEAEQEKVDKLKELLQMQGGGPGQGGGMGGGGGGGMDFIGRLRGGIKPRDVQRELIRKREEAAVQAWREEQRAAGLMDQNGRPIDPNNRPLKGPELDGLRMIAEGNQRPQLPGPRGIKRQRMVRGPNGQMIAEDEFIPLMDEQGPPAMINEGFGVGPGNDFDFGPDPRDARRMAARGRAQEAAVRQRARRQAFRDMRQGNIGQEEAAGAGGALLQQAGERLIQGNRLGQTAVQAIQQLTQQLAAQAREDGRMADQLNQLMRQLMMLQGGNNNGNRNQRRGN